MNSLHEPSPSTYLKKNDDLLVHILSLYTVSLYDLSALLT